MNDIDVLLRRDELPAAVDYLTRRGYLPTQEVDVAVDTATMHHLPRFIKAGVAGFEVHWSLCRLNQPYSIDTGELWTRAVPVQMAGTTLFGLAPEDLLLHLCLHTSYQHEFVFGLRPSCDIAAVIGRYGEGLDWGAVCARAQRWHWQRGVWLSLHLAQELVGAKVPPHVLAALEPEAVSPRLIETARRQIFTDKTFHREVISQAIALRAQSGLLSKLAYARRQLFPSSASVRLRYQKQAPGQWLPFYYALHWQGYLFRYGRTFWRRWTGDPATRNLLDRKQVVRAWLAGDSP